MPRAKREPQAAQRFLHKTGTSLCRALGIHRNTWLGWRREGAPAEKPHDEQAVRVWAAARRYRCPTEPCPELRELLADAGVDGYRSSDLELRLGGDRLQSGMDRSFLDLLPGESSYDEAVRAGVITYQQAEDRERLRKLEVDNRLKERKDQIEAGDLVPRAKLDDLAREIRRRIDQAAGQFGQEVAQESGLQERGAQVVVAQAANKILDSALNRAIQDSLRLNDNANHKSHKLEKP